MRRGEPSSAVSPGANICAVQAEGGEQLSAEGRDDEEDNRSDLYQPTERGDDDGEDLLLHLAELGDAADEFPGDGGGMHEEFEEDLVRLGQKTPIKPSEVRQHYISHVPYRAWCPHCPRGKGRSLQHSMKSAKDKKDERVRPRVSMDYFYLTKKNPNKEEDALPLLAIWDEPSMRMFSVALPSKGVEHQYNVAVVTKLVKYLGRTDANLAVFKSDTERSLVALRNAVQLRVPGCSAR